MVCIWGAGPVGILAAHCALHRNAKSVTLIDQVRPTIKINIDSMCHTRVQMENRRDQDQAPDFPGIRAIEGQAE